MRVCECARVRAYSYAYARMHVRVCVRVCVWGGMRAYACVRACVPAFVCDCGGACTRACARVRACVPAFVCGYGGACTRACARVRASLCAIVVVHVCVLARRVYLVILNVALLAGGRSADVFSVMVGFQGLGILQNGFPCRGVARAGTVHCGHVCRG